MPYIHVRAEQIRPGDEFRKTAPNGGPGDTVRVISATRDEAPGRILSVILNTTRGSFAYEDGHLFVVRRGE